MTLQQAYKILDIDNNTGRNLLKKKYRELMHKVHPDATLNVKAAYRYSAYEINEAYSVVSNHMDSSGENAYSNSAYSSKSTDYSYNYNADYEGNTDDKDSTYAYDWDAPENKNAYCDRNIYHYAENYNGENIGKFKIAKGKYIWVQEEDFRLFIRSIYECSKELLENEERKSDIEKNENVKLLYQTELAYLLSQQFIAATDMLNRILTSIEADGTQIFYVAAMLEMSPDAGTVRAGMKLYPSGIQRHRLYLSTGTGKEAGYVSLKDDRLYYILIPVLEQRRASIKVEVSQKQDRQNTRGLRKYKNIDLWVKLDNNKTLFPENINMQIDNLLMKYRNGD